jgi:hypothetical protein
MRKFHFVRIMFAALAFAALLTACQKDQVAPKGVDDAIELRANVPSTPVSDAGITPYIIDGANPGGNRTCEEVSIAFGCSFGNGDDTQNTPPFNGVQGPISWTSDGTYVTWTSTEPINAAVIVKGGADANVYFYGCGVDDCTDGDSGLASPLNASGGPAGLSNITFCWNLCEPSVECQEETAWSYGPRYTNKGNWATYTPYVANSVVTLFAGQTQNAGTVHFSAMSGGNIDITITFNPGWGFQNVNENLKIQDYTNAPAGNPAPGLFAHKFNGAGSPYTVTVPANNFYGVHVDAQYCE